MSEPTNAVLAEMVRQLRYELGEYKKETNADIKEIQYEAERNRRLTDEINHTMKYIHDAVDKMEGMMNNFINITNEQNNKINQVFTDQNKTIDDFVNSDKRHDRKKDFIVTVLQITAGIIGTILAFFASGKI